MNGEFEGRCVFITGAASGIGLAQAIEFLEQGAEVFGFDRDLSGLDSLARTYEGFRYAVGNVRVNEEVLEAVREAGEVDILCNTAGVLDGFAKTLETDEALWDRILETNVKGMFLVTNALLPSMTKRKSGVIVNMASIAGLVAGGGGAAYTASKHAVVGYTKQLSMDYCREGIRVNAIAPGAIETPMNAADFAGDGAMAKWVAEETPAGRWAQPEEVAKLTVYLASDASSYIHGTVIPIDGGWTAK
ncbi:3-oxoacyl-ACP reductase [Sporosarcina sp. PTS2304]|uniref:3-oxoacyl-ACP reductase n=1 Tax=Sporosarcina sp. PTS2304 TaxID=2283194 RepID=UPI000E0D192C|nr:3-oxoacyl-ACP reductase [Sporosarcina sp. PTS2304]AXI00929.1 3-oxoacyl-ACP reductase [Sporosarcina sp. PTS2304]